MRRNSTPQHSPRAGWQAARSTISESAGLLAALCLAASTALAGGARRVVATDAELRAALPALKAGDTLLLAPGHYTGGISVRGLQGAEGRPIVIAASDRARPPVIAGGGSGLHLSDVVHLELRDLVFTGAVANGLNIDDGGSYETPSHHVVLRNLRVENVGPQGNRDGIKLSGVDDFVVTGCRVERWGGGGSAIDMVGCRRGRIDGCTFRAGGGNGVQAKGGSAEIAVTACRFEEAGLRAINLGGSTGLPYFRPRPEGFEARSLRVEGCTFTGSDAPIAFVGVDGAVVRHNTFYRPRRWVLRILRETNLPGFVPTRGGIFEGNVVVFRSQEWSEGGVNLGPPGGIAPETFRFRGNAWYCEDNPARSAPRLPTPEADALIGRDPLLRDPARGDFRLRPGSPAAGRGADAYRPSADR